MKGKRLAQRPARIRSRCLSRGAKLDRGERCCDFADGPDVERLSAMGQGVIDATVVTIGGQAAQNWDSMRSGSPKRTP
jgi:hypothetical protein